MITSKWPGLWIEGDKVTKEQAEEIILRTTSQYLSPNNKEYIEDVYKFINIYSSKDSILFDTNAEEIEEAIEEFQANPR